MRGLKMLRVFLKFLASTSFKNTFTLIVKSGVANPNIEFCDEENQVLYLSGDYFPLTELIFLESSNLGDKLERFVLEPRIKPPIWYRTF